MDQNSFNNTAMFNHQGPPQMAAQFPYGSPPQQQPTEEAQGQKTERPEHIKRPMNQFMVFSKGEREKLKRTHPDAHNTVISQELAKRWNQLTEEQKAPYKAEAERLKREHEQMFPNYKYQPKRKPKKGVPYEIQQKAKAPPKQAARPMAPIQNIPANPYGQLPVIQMNMMPMAQFQGFYNQQQMTSAKIENQNPTQSQNQNPNPMMAGFMMMQNPGYQFSMSSGNQNQMTTSPQMSQSQTPLQMNSPIPNYFQSITNPSQHVPSIYTPFLKFEDVRASSVGTSSEFTTSPSSTSPTSSRATPPSVKDETGGFKQENFFDFANS